MMGEREGVGGAGAASSRKEKKKQVKEERDRLKQAEKKKRRLEKALANAAAIRSELEKKKQKRKEEEQRLDEEGAALAEAVALQVLVDEECGDGVSPEGERKDLGLDTSPKGTEKFMLIGIADSAGVTNPNSELLWGNFWKQSDPVEGAGLDCKESVMDWNKAEFYEEACSSTNEKVRKSNEAAKAAGMAAGSAAAQAVAALRIAEEARAEAEADKIAAEAAMNEAVDHSDIEHKPHLLEPEKKVLGKSIEKERDELRLRLEYTERKLKEKIRQVLKLEQDLEEVTRYLLEFKAMFESSKEETHAMHADTKGNTGSSRHEISTAESSGGTVDQ